MNVLSIMRKGLISLALVSGFSNCTKPAKEKNEKAPLEIQSNQIDALKGNEEFRLEVIDSVFEFQEYINATKFRLSENTKNLDDIKSEFKSDKSKIRLAFEGELFKLNKKNLELKSKVNDSLKYQTGLEDPYFTELDKEIGILELSITDLRKRSE
jgi:hypothetical protein